MNSTTQKHQSRRGFLAAFRDHPASVGETYFGHMAFALHFSWKLFAAGFCAIIHAFIPPLFETAASRRVGELYGMCQHRGPNQQG